MSEATHQEMVRIPTRWPIYTFVAGIVAATTLYVDMRTTAKDNSRSITEIKESLSVDRAKSVKTDLEIAVMRTNAENTLRVLQEIKADIRDIKKGKSTNE